jgi:hypothetical protein
MPIPTREKSYTSVNVNEIAGKSDFWLGWSWSLNPGYETAGPLGK